MWTRRELKDRAKQALRTTYWKAFLVSLVLAVIGGGLPSCSLNLGGRGGGGGASMTMPGWTGDAMHGAMFFTIVLIAIAVAVVVVLAILALRIFVCFPVEVGVRQYFKQAAQDEVNMNYLGFGFAQGRYGPIVKAMLLRAVYNFLWFLLLIVPGIVKGYAYSQVPYILADNPGIGTRRAVELSDRMTRGHKWNMFVLDLSFIGWYLLGMIALVVGTLFVLPYVNATKAELYLVLRRQALDNGICSRAELDLPEYA